MKKSYRFETLLNKITLVGPIPSKVIGLSLATRMLQVFGEGELGIKSQGRFLHSSFCFSQETGAIGQQSPRNGGQRPKLERELSAWMRVDSDSTPHFFFQASHGQAPAKARPWRYAKPVTALPGRYAKPVTAPGRYAKPVTALPGRYAKPVTALPGRLREASHGSAGTLS